jgi:hypothetical protein
MASERDPNVEARCGSCRNPKHAYWYVSACPRFRLCTRASFYGAVAFLIPPTPSRSFSTASKRSAVRRKSRFAIPPDELRCRTFARPSPSRVSTILRWTVMDFISTTWKRMAPAGCRSYPGGWIDGHSSIRGIRDLHNNGRSDSVRRRCGYSRRGR